jgi:Rad3-related DNA helicase
MGHCVGGYWPDVQGGRSSIWSLRDPKHHPHATVEIEPFVHGGGSRLVQAQGKSDSEPIPEYQKRISDWLDSIKDKTGLHRGKQIDNIYDLDDYEGDDYYHTGNYNLPSHNTVDYADLASQIAEEAESGVDVGSYVESLRNIAREKGGLKEVNEVDYWLDHEARQRIESVEEDLRQEAANTRKEMEEQYEDYKREHEDYNDLHEHDDEPESFEDWVVNTHGDYILNDISEDRDFEDEAAEQLGWGYGNQWW